MLTIFCCLTAVLTVEPTQASDDRQPTFAIPASVLAGSDLAIKLTGLPPNAVVRIDAERIAGWRERRLYRSMVRVKADASGVADLSRQAPIEEPGSSYSGIEPLGLLWSMKPTGGRITTAPTKDSVRFTASIEKAGSLKEVATGSLQIKSRHDDVKESPLTNDGSLEGAFIMMRPSNKPLPVIITLGGSEGGDSSARRTAPGLASRGFAVVGVPYYSPAYGDARQQFPTLPRSFEEIPLDRLEAVIKAIDKHPKLDGRRIGLHGVSKGGEFVLAVASRNDRFKAVAAFVPSDVIWEGWGSSRKTSSFSYGGEPLPYVPYKGMQETIARMSKGERVSIRVPHDAGRAANPERISAARIKVEKIKGAVMVVGGDKDRTWDSGGMCRRIKATRDAAGLNTETWISKEAGHYLSGHAFNPMAYASPDASFRTETYPAMLRFFAKNLSVGVQR